jgi:hypothetical protein
MNSVISVWKKRTKKLSSDMVSLIDMRLIYCGTERPKAVFAALGKLTWV